MSNYNTKLQSNNIDLQTVIQTLQNKAAGGLDTMDATATANDILSGKTAYANGQKITGNIAFAPAKIITPSTTSQTAISAGYYASGKITVVGDSNLIADNIKKGTSIFGVNGNYEGTGGEADYGGEDGLITGDLTIYTNNRVTKIRNSAFWGCQNLTSVNFPVCSYIGNYAFRDCSRLTSVSFPVCSYIGRYAFQFCSNLTSISFPACSYIEDNAFYCCSSLTSVSFPVCSRINGYTFYGCDSLASVNFPVCSYIGSDAFCACNGLTSASFPRCSSIEYYAFFLCESLALVNFPMCSYISGYAFGACSSLTSADFGGNSTISKCVIYSYAFSSCTSLTNLTLRYSFVAALSNINAFINTPLSISTLTGSFGSIYVPASLVNAYKSATNWATYADRITAIPTGGAN